MARGSKTRAWCFQAGLILGLGLISSIGLRPALANDSSSPIGPHRSEVAASPRFSDAFPSGVALASPFATQGTHAGTDAKRARLQTVLASPSFNLCAGALPKVLPDGATTPNACEDDACEMTRLPSLLDFDEANADAALGLYAMVVCAAGLTTAQVPTPGTALELLTAPLNTLLKVTDKTNWSVAKARLGRLMDQHSQPSFQIAISGSYARPSNAGASNAGTSPAKTNQTRTAPTGASQATGYSFTLTATNTSLGDDSHEGVLVFQLRPTGGATPPSLARTMSLRYIRTATEFDYRLIMSETPLSPAVALSSSGELIRSPAAGRDPSCKGSGWCRNYHELVANLDGSGYGRFALSSLATRDTMAASVFNIATQANNQAIIYFGHAAPGSNPQLVDISAIQSLQCLPRPSGALAGGNVPYSGLVQKQTLIFDHSRGLWQAEAPHLASTPTASCNGPGANSAEPQAGVSSIPLRAQASTLKTSYPHSLYPAEQYAREWVDLTPPSSTLESSVHILD